jgi:hypothetical protein
MDNLCKNCQFYKADLGYKYGDCERIVELSQTELGLKNNPERFYDIEKGEWNNDNIEC